MSSINKNSSTPLGCGMNCKINVTSVVSGASSISADISLNPTGRNIGIQPPHKGYRLWIKTILLTKEKLPLGLNDSDYYLEGCFQEIGCRISYSTRYYVAYVYLQPV